MTGSPPSTPVSLTGLLVVDKPEGPTSMDVCRRIRRALVAGGAPKRVKVGHGGTLDPLATGVVVVLIGRATRLCERVMAGQKVYEATIELGVTSTTDDREREILRRSDATPPDPGMIDEACRGFVGEIQQVPPAHSAMKVGGRRAYELARAGNAPELAPRPVRIDRIDVLAYDWPTLRIEVVCGKGTYIRSLARDLGERLGVGGMLAALRRVRSGDFGIDRAVPLDDLPDVLTQADLLPLPPEA